MIQSTSIKSEHLNDFDAFFSRLDAGGRANVDRHLAACENDATRDHIRLWKRLAGFLAKLTPHSIRITGQRAIQFYIADGKYRLQLFALEDMRDGKLSLYAADAVDAALRAGILLPAPREDHATTYPLGEASDQYLKIESLSAATTTSAPEYYKHLLDWNRKAIRITMSTTASPAQVRVVESLCTLAAQR